MVVNTGNYNPFASNLTTTIKKTSGTATQIQQITIEHESLKKNLNANEVAREIDDIEKRLKHFERCVVWLSWLLLLLMMCHICSLCCDFGYCHRFSHNISQHKNHCMERNYRNSTIFELKEFVETKTRETDYEAVKHKCLKVSFKRLVLFSLS